MSNTLKGPSIRQHSRTAACSCLNPPSLTITPTFPAPFKASQVIELEVGETTRGNVTPCHLTCLTNVKNNKNWGCTRYQHAHTYSRAQTPVLPHHYTATNISGYLVIQFTSFSPQDGGVTEWSVSLSSTRGQSHIINFSNTWVVAFEGSLKTSWKLNNAPLPCVNDCFFPSFSAKYL